MECTTDNIKRTFSAIRLIFSKYGCSLGGNGSLSFIFDRKGIFHVKKGNRREDDFTMQVIEAGAEDVELDDDIFTVTTSMEDFGIMHKKLSEMKAEVESANLQMIPKTTTALSLEHAQQVMRMIEAIEENEDVQHVYHNLEMTEQLAETL